MRDRWRPDFSGTPLSDAPTWVRAVQAGIVGVIAGLALYTIVSIAVVHARDSIPAHAGPKECKKAEPARDVVAPPAQGPALSSLTLTTPAL